jgi:hypothetical protein
VQDELSQIRIDALPVGKPLHRATNIVRFLVVIGLRGQFDPIARA